MKATKTAGKIRLLRIKMTKEHQNKTKNMQNLQKIMSKTRGEQTKLLQMKTT